MSSERLHLSDRMLQGAGLSIAAHGAHVVAGAIGEIVTNAREGGLELEDVLNAGKGVAGGLTHVGLGAAVYIIGSKSDNK